MMNDQEFIQETFKLALQGKGHTWPNPLVGAVIVKNGKIIGKGYHHQQGQDHAEIDALKNCSESPEGATVYVNLEPCCHTHKTTPPCAQRLIKEKIKKVVISNLDPNPSVNGKGIQLLKDNGVEVVSGILEEVGEDINEVFFVSQRQKRPFIHFKSAVTLDGKTALRSGESQWITGTQARLHVHELRSFHQGIIIGGETLRKDNPRLTVRLNQYSGRQPWRIIISRSADLPAHSHVFNDEFKHQTLIYTEQELRFSFPSDRVIRIKNLQDVMKDLFSRKLINIMLESGANLASGFLKEKLIDRVSLYQNPSFIGEGKNLLSDLNLHSLAARPRLSKLQSQWLGDDHYLTGRFLCSRD